MPPVIIPNTARSAIRMQQNGKQRVNVLHFTRSGGFLPSDLNTLNVDLVQWWKTFVKPYMPQNLTLVDITSTNLHDAVQEQDVQPCLADCVGTAGGDNEPGNVTSTISWRTDIAGRRYRGRTYWPAYLVGHTNPDDTLASAMVIALGVAAGNLVFGSITNGAVLAVASRVLSASRIVTGFIIENVLDSQRRRLPGRGT